MSGAATADITLHPPARDFCQLPTEFHAVFDHCAAATGQPVQCLPYNDHFVVRYDHPAGPYFYIIDQSGSVIRTVSLADNVTDVETLLTSTVMALVSRLRGRLTLHGAAISVGGRLIGLLADKGMGKSTTALALLQRGHALLSDDIISLETPAGIAHPGLPESRQTLGTLAAFGMNPADHDPVFRAEPAETQDKRTIALTGDRAGMYCPTAQPLDAIYLLDRVGAEATPKFEHLNPVQSLRALLPHISFAPQPLMDGEFKFLGQLVGKIPVRRITYPSDLKQLDQLCICLEQDVDEIPGRDPA